MEGNMICQQANKVLGLQMHAYKRLALVECFSRSSLTVFLGVLFRVATWAPSGIVGIVLLPRISAIGMNVIRRSCVLQVLATPHDNRQTRKMQIQIVSTTRALCPCKVRSNSLRSC